MTNPIKNIAKAVGTWALAKEQHYVSFEVMESQLRVRVVEEVGGRFSNLAYLPVFEARKLYSRYLRQNYKSW